MRNIIKHNDDFNEWMNTLLYKNISLTLLERVDVGCVWEVSWRERQTATYWPQVLLTIAALLPHLGWVAQPWVTEGPKPSVCRWLSIRHLVSNCNWNWLKPSGYITVWHPPASAVPPLIYTGASPDWRFSRGSIYNISCVYLVLIICSHIFKCVQTND